MIVGGIKYRSQRFNPKSASVTAIFLFVAIIGEYTYSWVLTRFWYLLHQQAPKWPELKIEIHVSLNIISFLTTGPNSTLFHRNVPHYALYQNCIISSTPQYKMVTQAKNRNILMTF